MTNIEAIQQELKSKRYHGLQKTIQERTGLSLPTIRKYLNGDVYHPTAIKVFKTAKEIIEQIEN
jgi:hypothetical protein